MKKQIANIFKNSKIVFIGVGNILRKDDGVGPYVASGAMRAAPCVNKNYNFIDAGEAPENYIGSIAAYKPDAAVIIYALHFKAAPGAMEIINADKARKTTFSTHGMPLELFAQRLKEAANAKIFLLGIQPASLNLSEGLTRPVKIAADRLIKLICEEMKNA